MSGKRVTFPSPGIAWDLIRSTLFCLLAVELVANHDAIAEKFVGALPFAAKLAVGNFLGVPFEDADPRELLLEEVNDVVEGMLYPSKIRQHCPERSGGSTPLGV